MRTENVRNDIDNATGRADGNREIADAQHRYLLGPAIMSRKRGSSWSRSASPTKLSEKAVIAIDRPGKKSSQGARVIKMRDSASILPQLGISGGAPSPRKSSEAATSCAKANTKLACTSSGEIRFGRICLRIVQATPAPRLIAAST